jgi:hypothetical protein
VVLYPSVVNVPFVRTRGALARAVEYADGGEESKAVAQLAIVRAQLKSAWAGEKYLIDNAPPAVPVGDVIASGAPVGAVSPFASAEDSGAELFNVYREVATTAVALTDSAQSGLQNALGTTISATLNGRDAAIEYIHAHQPPPPPADDRAAASGAPVAAGWSTIMQNVSLMIDDEIQQLDSMLGGGASEPNRGSTSGQANGILQAAKQQDTKTKATIDQWWPQLPVGD